MTLETAADCIGCVVIYKSFEGCKPKDFERGIITSVNEKFIFVRYGNDTNSKATLPCDLKLEYEGGKK